MSTSSKDLSPELLKRSRLRTSSKDDMDIQIKNGHANKKWLILKEKIMCLNKTNYVQYGKVIIGQIKLLLSSTASNNAIYANAILAMIYECSIRELITNSFPVSANLIDTLTTGCSEMEILKPLIDQHLKRLQAKLHNFTIPKGSDVGVLALLLCIFKLDQITDRDSSSIKAIIEQLIKDIGEFVEFEMTSDSCNDSFIMLLFGLIWFSLQVDQKNIDVKLIEKYVRRIIVMKKSKVTTLGNVLALDILEQMGKMKKNIELYNAIYSKHLKSSDCYLLEGVKDILTTTSYPENIDSDDISDNVFEGGDSLANSEDKLVARKLSRTESIGTAIKSMSNNNTDVSPIKEEEGDNWSQSISGHKEKVNDIEEKILIPERCVTRVFGLEGAIKRQIELNSSTKIIVTKREDPVKPEMSSLTAHRLITGALGIAPQMPQEKVVEEKEKLQSAKVRRQTDVKWREPQREMIISGTMESIKKAKDCIDDIITKVETVSIHLDFTVDDLLDKYDSKLKTIETLLNVYMEIEEQEDNSVNIDISGDASSCKDAKKLIFEEIGSFRSQHGHLFIIPKEMKQLLPDRAKTSQLVNTVRRLSGGRLMYLNGPDGTCVFVSGYPYQVNRALDIFQKINIELLCSMSECTDDTMVFTCDDLCDYVEDRFDKSNGSNVDATDWRKKQPSLMNKFHKNEGNVEPVSLISYTKEELLKLSQCELSKILPNALKLALREDPYVFEKVILAECEATGQIPDLTNTYIDSSYARGEVELNSKNIDIKTFKPETTSLRIDSPIKHVNTLPTSYRVLQSASVNRQPPIRVDDINLSWRTETVHNKQLHRRTSDTYATTINAHLNDETPNTTPNVVSLTKTTSSTVLTPPFDNNTSQNPPVLHTKNKTNIELQPISRVTDSKQQEESTPRVYSDRNQQEESLPRVYIDLTIDDSSSDEELKSKFIKVREAKEKFKQRLENDQNNDISPAVKVEDPSDNRTTLQTSKKQISEPLFNSKSYVESSSFKKDKEITTQIQFSVKELRIANRKKKVPKLSEKEIKEKYESYMAAVSIIVDDVDTNSKPTVSTDTVSQNTPDDVLSPIAPDKTLYPSTTSGDTASSTKSSSLQKDSKNATLSYKHASTTNKLSSSVNAKTSKTSGEASKADNQSNNTTSVIRSIRLIESSTQTDDSIEYPTRVQKKKSKKKESTLVNMPPKSIVLKPLILPLVPLKIPKNVSTSTSTSTDMSDNKPPHKPVTSFPSKITESLQNYISLTDVSTNKPLHKPTNDMSTNKPLHKPTNDVSTNKPLHKPTNDMTNDKPLHKPTTDMTDNKPPHTPIMSFPSKITESLQNYISRRSPPKLRILSLKKDSAMISTSSNASIDGKLLNKSNSQKHNAIKTYVTSSLFNTNQDNKQIVTNQDNKEIDTDYVVESKQNGANHGYKDITTKLGECNQIVTNRNDNKEKNYTKPTNPDVIYTNPANPDVIYKDGKPVYFRRAVYENNLGGVLAFTRYEYVEI